MDRVGVPQQVPLLPANIDWPFLALVGHLPLELQGDPHFAVHLGAGNIDFASADLKHVPLVARLDSVLNDELFMCFFQPQKHLRFKVSDRLSRLKVAQ